MRNSKSQLEIPFHNYVQRMFGAAIHEAAHAVVACHFGIQVYEIKLDPNWEQPDVDGSVWVEEIDGKTPPDRLRQRIVVSFAGADAQRRLTGLSTAAAIVQWGHKDMNDAFQAARLLLGDAADTQQIRILSEALDKVDEILQAPALSRQIVELAAELICCPSQALTGDQIDVLLHGARPPIPQRKAMSLAMLEQVANDPAVSQKPFFRRMKNVLSLASPQASVAPENPTQNSQAVPFSPFEKTGKGSAPEQA